MLHKVVAIQFVESLERPMKKCRTLIGSFSIAPAFSREDRAETDDYQKIGGNNQSQESADIPKRTRM